MEIALETREHYKTHPFAYDPDQKICYYFDKVEGEDEPRMCAGGRLMIEPEIFTSGASIHVLLKEYGEQILKPEYRGHPYSFYSFLQHYHDNVARKPGWMGWYLARTFGTDYLPVAFTTR